ncbi:MAG: 5'-nucleotidase C-terminal domain-containing protein [Gaiellaceae bacterium]
MRAASATTSSSTRSPPASSRARSRSARCSRCSRSRNTLETLDLTGAQIDTLLEQQFDNPEPGQNRILQVSNGFTYTWDASAPVGSRVDPSAIELGGVVLDPSATYRITVNSFLAEGGDTSPSSRRERTACRGSSTRRRSPTTSATARRSRPVRRTGSRASASDL